MKKIINILSIMICFTILNSFTAKGEALKGFQYVGCGKSVYTNNSTVPEIPEIISEKPY